MTKLSGNMCRCAAINVTIIQVGAFTVKVLQTFVVSVLRGEMRNRPTVAGLDVQIGAFTLEVSQDTDVAVPRRAMRCRL